MYSFNSGNSRHSMFADRAYSKIKNNLGDDIRTREDSRKTLDKQIAELTESERIFFNFTLNLLKQLSQEGEIYLVHSSLSTETIIESGSLFSHDELINRGLSTKNGSTYEIDKRFGNTDFVFFRIKFGFKYLEKSIERILQINEFNQYNYLVLKSKELPPYSFFTPMDWWDCAEADNNYLLNTTAYGEKNILEAISLKCAKAYKWSDEKTKKEFHELMQASEKHPKNIINFANWTLTNTEFKLPCQVEIRDFDLAYPTLSK